MENGKWAQFRLCGDVSMTRPADLVRMTAPNVSTPYWDLKNLVAWQVAMDLAEGVYRATRRFPQDERFGLRMQIRRSAVSVASNIAEGHGRSSRREYARFVLIARGSLKELETQLMIGRRLGYLASSTEEELLALTTRVNRLLTGLRKRLQA
jgi:four helix bundle protein